jgi:hypothetical protein
MAAIWIRLDSIIGGDCDTVTIRIPAAAWAALLVVVSAPIQAQWPSSPSGTPNLSAPAPRTKDGKPDLSGLWEPNGTKYSKNIAADLKPGEVPFQPEAEALFKANSKNESSSANCLPPGVPRIDATPTPFKIVQTPEEVTILYGTLDIYRQIFTDGRGLPKDPDPNWLGYSSGKWEGDTLVVESAGFNGKIWLDDLGHPTSEALHVTERFRRRDFGHMELQITIDDPKSYTKPWTVTEDPHLVPDAELRESACWRSK